MVAHDEYKKGEKAGSGRDALDPARSDERSWIHARTAALVLKEFPDGNGFSNEDWSRCYKQAKEEWEKQNG